MPGYICCMNVTNLSNWFHVDQLSRDAKLLNVRWSYILKSILKWFCRCQNSLHRPPPLPRCWRARSFSAAAKWDFGRLCHCLQECPSTLSHFAKYLIQPTSLLSVLWFTAQHFLLETCDLSDLWGFAELIFGATGATGGRVKFLSAV